MTKMEYILRPFEVLVTSLRISAINIARIKLTIFYEAVVFLILALFSVGVYGLFDKSLGEDLGYPQLGIGIQLLGHTKTELAKDIIVEEKQRLLVILLLLDGVILVVAGGMSFVLAGYTLKPIQESYDRQKKFLADAAHEFRTPLSVMKTGMQVALKERLNHDGYARIMKESVEEIDFLNAMVDDLLFLAKSDYSKKTPFTEVDFEAMIEKQVTVMQSYAKEKQVTLTIEGLEGMRVFGNEAHLKRLLTNLIHNAIDYNIPGGKVGVSCWKDRHWAHLTVFDTGVGISQGNLKHIFDRFYKADSSRAKKSGGAGLGLSIVQGIVRSHHGQIHLESIVGQGTTVFIMLPLA